MKAVYFKEHGEIDMLRYGDVPAPRPAPGEVLIRVRACALNYLDIWVRRGWPGLQLDKPHWCGADVAGEIARAGAQASDWEEGARVVVDPGINRYTDAFVRRGESSLSPGYAVLGEHVRGGAAEWVAVPEANVVALPDHVEFTDGAAPLLVSLTAWRMLITRGRLRAGESVLIVGAGGGVNSMAIQIAKLAGATVYVVAQNKQKAEHAAALGADVVIDRSETQWGKEIYRLTGKRGVDVVVDNVGQATLSTSMMAVARGGRILIVGNTSGALAELDIRYIFGKQISLIGSTMGTHDDFLTVTKLLWSKRIQPVIDRVMPLSEGVAAYRILEDGAHFGKIVLTP
jgi:NADPH:quinone reductase-like Zn-dependent oxidoreductase